MQDNAQKSPRDMATLGRYRETNSSFWRGFFMGYFSPTSSARLVNPQHYPADPFLEDQKRIGADMYTAMGLIAETAEKIGSPTSLQQTTESSPVTKPNTRKNNTLSQLS